MCLLFIGPVFESREDSTLKTKDLGRAIIVAISLFGGFRATTFAQVTHTELFTFSGDSAGDEFGLSVSGAGDVNGDGFADLIVGAPGDDNNGIASGSARVLSGIDGSTLFTFDGDSAFDLFGDSVSGAGDVNGDGFADLIVGAPFDDNGGIASGSAGVLSGFDGSTLFTFDGDSAGDFFGVSVNGLGDLNGDGLDDFVVGSNGFARVFVSSVPVPTAAVPEPSTIAFLSLGFAGFGCRQLRRRKLKQQQAAQILSN